MLALEKKIIKAFNSLKVEEGEEKTIICIVGKNNMKNLESEAILIVEGNDVNSVKNLRSVLENKEAEKLNLILEMIKEYI